MHAKSDDASDRVESQGMDIDNFRFDRAIVDDRCGILQASAAEVFKRETWSSLDH